MRTRSSPCRFSKAVENAMRLQLFAKSGTLCNLMLSSLCEKMLTLFQGKSPLGMSRCIPSMVRKWSLCTCRNAPFKVKGASLRPIDSAIKVKLSKPGALELTGMLAACLQHLCHKNRPTRKRTAAGRHEKPRYPRKPPQVALSRAMP